MKLCKQGIILHLNSMQSFSTWLLNTTVETGALPLELLLFGSRPGYPTGL